MGNDPARIHEAGTNVFGLKPSVALENRFGTVAGGEHPKHVLDGEPAPADDRFAAKDLRVRRDSLQETILCFGHDVLPATILRPPVGVILGVIRSAKGDKGRQQPESTEKTGNT